MRAFTSVVSTAVLVATLAFPISSFAESASESSRIEKLETRLRELETRMANLEASTHKQMGMMMEHGAGMGQKPMQMDSMMGQKPNENQNMGGAAMPQGGANQDKSGQNPAPSNMGAGMGGHM